MRYDQLRIVSAGSRCNLRCAYCLAGYAEENQYNSSGFNEGAILNLIQSHDFSSISIWGGEPFYNFEKLKRVVEFCRGYYPELPIIVISNGTALSEEKIGFIRKHNLNITLSHDAANQYFRGQDYLKDETSLALIRRISDLGFTSVIHKYNYDFQSIFAYFDQIRDVLQRDFFWGFELLQPSGPQSLRFIPGNEELERFSLSLDFLLEQFVQGHPLAYTALYPTLSAMADTIDRGSSPDCRCRADRRLTVTTDGRVAFCQVMAEKGNFAFPALKLPAMCNSCELFRFCRGYCPGMNDEERQKVCSFYKMFYTKMDAFLHNLQISLLTSRPG